MRQRSRTGTLMLCDGRLVGGEREQNDEAQGQAASTVEG